MARPIACLVQGSVHQGRRAHAGGGKRSAKPHQPAVVVCTGAAGRVQLGVIRVAARGEFRGHADKARIRPNFLRQGEIDERAADAAVSVFERMDRFEPQVRNSGTQQPVHFPARAVEPLEEPRNLARHAARGRRFEMHDTPRHRAADDLHRFCMRSKRSGRHALNAGESSGKQRVLPAAQALRTERLVPAGGGVLHHVEQSFDCAQARGLAAGQSQALGDGRAHAFDTELLALDGSGGERLGRPDECFGIARLLHSEGFGKAEYLALGAPRGGEGGQQRRCVVLKRAPVVRLPIPEGRCAAGHEAHSRLLRFIM